MQRIGRKFGRLTVMSDAGNKRYFCECDCGGSKTVLWEKLRTGKTKSCGCLAAERVSSARTGNDIGSSHPLYNTWHSMVRRCHSEGFPPYKKYGAKGISVCDEWRKSAKAFVDYIGPKPTPHHTLDRIDPAGNYEPGNCRWADRITQETNKRIVTAYPIEIGGEVRFVSEWSGLFGVNASKVTKLIREGVDPLVALLTVALKKLVWKRSGGNAQQEQYDKCPKMAEVLAKREASEIFKLLRP